MAGGRRKVRAEGFEPVPFLDLPGDVEAVHAAHAGDEQGTAKLAAGELARDDLGIRLAGEHIVDVVIKDAAACAVTLVAFFGKEGLRFEEVCCFYHGRLELLMLEGMKRVVMHENADRALCRQVMRGMVEHMLEVLAAAGLDFRVGMGM
jgi:hypothetical protein